MTDDTERYWSKFASTYEESVRYVIGADTRRWMEEALSREHTLGELIELGCGTGHFTRIVAANAKRVVATDLSDTMLAETRKSLKGLINVEVLKANGEHTAFADRSFDTVLMVNVIHIVADPVAVLNECRRLLRAGGRLLVLNNTDYGLGFFKKVRFYLRFLRKFGLPPLRGRNYSPESLRKLVNDAGFDVSGLETADLTINTIFLKALR